MRPDAFDNEMKKLLDEAEYRPSEASWQKLQAALKEQAGQASDEPVLLPAKRRSFFPATWAAAAALVGVAFVGYLLYPGDDTVLEGDIVKEQESSDRENGIAQALESGVAADDNMAERAEPVASQTIARHKGDLMDDPSFASAKFASNTGARQQRSGPIPFHIEVAALSYLPSSVAGMSDMSTASYAPLTTTTSAVVAKRQRFEEDNSGGFYAADWSADDLEKMSLFEDPFVYGASIKAGFPTVGPMQLNGGLTINTDIGERFFSESTIDLSYTDVRYDKALYYRANENGSISNIGSSDNKNAANLALATGETTTTYSNNVLAVGLASVVGYKVNRSVSVALGADMYRNFNNDLILKDNPMVSQTTLRATVAPLKWISMWDAGVRAQVGLRLNDHLGLVGQYRKGLVNYMMDANGAAIKNSSVSLGLNVKFNP